MGECLGEDEIQTGEAKPPDSQVDYTASSPARERTEERAKNKNKVPQDWGI
jgi:hypothetical protein